LVNLLSENLELNQNNKVIENKTFKTKTGYCHILPDRIVLTRDGVIGNVAKMTVGNNITPLGLIFRLSRKFKFVSNKHH